MEKIGEYLRKFREEKNISLEEVSEKTKIKIRILEDIENDNYNNLGGAGYAKAMILTYGKVIDADTKKILENLNLSESLSNIDKSKSIQPKKLLIPATIFSFFLLIILVFVLVFIAIKYYPEWRAKSQFQKKITTQVKKSDSAEKKPKVTAKINETQLPRKNKIKPKNTENKKKTEALVINEEALKDTTDYLDNLLFKHEKSPFNYKE